MTNEQQKHLQQLLGPLDGPAPKLSAAERAELNALYKMHAAQAIRDHRSMPVKLCDWCNETSGDDLLCRYCGDAVRRENVTAAMELIGGQLSAPVVTTQLLEKIEATLCDLAEEVNQLLREEMIEHFGL